MPRLDEIVQRKLELENIFEEQYGEITEELEKVWEDNQIELKAKIDSYGYAIQTLTQAIDMLKEKKKIRDERIKDAIKRLEINVEKMKQRLHHHSNGEPLRGDEWSFHPYTSAVTKSIDTSKVEDEYISYVIPRLSQAEYDYLIEDVRMDIEGAKGNADYEALTLLQPLLQKIIGAEMDVKTSDLPKEHPALVKEYKSSVRIR